MPSMYKRAHAEHLIARHIGLLIVRDKIRDPRVSNVLSIGAVKLSRDLHHAQVYVSGYMRPSGLQKAIDGLNHAAGYIQHHIARHLQLRIAPKLHFIVDESIHNGFQLTQMLKQLDTTEQSTE